MMRFLDDECYTNVEYFLMSTAWWLQQNACLIKPIWAAKKSSPCCYQMELLPSTLSFKGYLFWGSQGVFQNFYQNKKARSICMYRSFINLSLYVCGLDYLTIPLCNREWKGEIAVWLDVPAAWQGSVHLLWFAWPRQAPEFWHHIFCVLQVSCSCGYVKSAWLQLLWPSLLRKRG